MPTFKTEIRGEELSLIFIAVKVASHFQTILIRTLNSVGLDCINPTLVFQIVITLLKITPQLAQIMTQALACDAVWMQVRLIFRLSSKNFI